MEKQKVNYHGAKVELIKDDAIMKRHIYVSVNDKSVLHLIENEKGNLNVFRYDLPDLRICELITTYEALNINHVLTYLRKKDFN